MEVGNVDCDEGMGHSMSRGLGFHFNGAPASPPVMLDLFPQAPWRHASASLVSLPGTLNSANEKSEVCSPNSLDLNKTHSSNGQDELQDDFSGEDGLLRISNEQEEDGIKRRFRLSGIQYAHLEECFKENPKVNIIRKEAVAKQLNISPRKVQVWFQNKRQRTKSKQNEMEGKQWKGYYKALIMENKRLQKELAEIKALETPFLSDITFPAAPLMVCPSCQRVFSTYNATQFTNSESNQY